MENNESCNFELKVLHFINNNGYNFKDKKLNTEEGRRITNERILECRNKQDFFNLPIFEENQQIDKMMIEKLSDKNEANMGPPCPNCKSNRFYVTIQRRSADEAVNNELHCPGCGLIQFS